MIELGKRFPINRFKTEKINAKMPHVNEKQVAKKKKF